MDGAPYSSSFCDQAVADSLVIADVVNNPLERIRLELKSIDGLGCEEDSFAAVPRRIRGLLPLRKVLNRGEVGLQQVMCSSAPSHTDQFASIDHLIQVIEDRLPGETRT